ncbi:MAG: prephenate dehydrogenase/arogenate dehydrogenase family protein [Bacteroidetes bacterium]|jgi:prephenate dehydrogenase|nr:prephenate dehydrogenase/arogenate dehydrogenase family protein [Bacteroidota bacterium]
MIQHVTIVGTGLIGGSLALAWQAALPDVQLTGFDTPEVLDAAHARGALDARAASLEAAVAEAELVVLATPLRAMLPLMNDMAPHLPEGVVVTDVGSVKRPVLAHAAEALPAHATFIGGHPMAGSENDGIDAADPLLFENATYVLCPPDDTEVPAALRTLIDATGARIRLMDAPTHDRVAATVSHLPQLVAVALAQYAGERHATDGATLDLAAGGFRDLTRIASSPFDLWRDILTANEGPVLDALGGFAATIQTLRNRLIAEDHEALAAIFDDAHEARATIPARGKGFLEPLADVYVRAQDRPGELVTLTTALADAGLNIKEIELLRVREGTDGTFRLSFSDLPTAEEAAAVLEDAGFGTMLP